MAQIDSHVEMEETKVISNPRAGDQPSQEPLQTLTQPQFTEINTWEQPADSVLIVEP